MFVWYNKGMKTMFEAHLDYEAKVQLERCKSCWIGKWYTRLFIENINEIRPEFQKMAEQASKQWEQFPIGTRQL
jgi:hypothetical protein